jgi:hypothetical protein
MVMSLSEEDAVRYRRQIIMPQIGAAGQQSMKKAAAMVAGVGGPGGLSACYSFSFRGSLRAPKSSDLDDSAMFVPFRPLMPHPFILAWFH